MERAQETLGALEQAGADPRLMALLCATYRIHRAEGSDYLDAIVGLEQCQNLPGYRVAGQAMLATAHMYAGHEAEYYRRLAKLNDSVPESWLDRVYKGFAQVFGAPQEAVATLREATRERSSPETEIILARALDTVASHSLQSTSSKRRERE
jgi:hypothetical protein